MPTANSEQPDAVQRLLSSANDDEAAECLAQACGQLRQGGVPPATLSSTAGLGLSADLLYNSIAVERYLDEALGDEILIGDKQIVDRCLKFVAGGKTLDAFRDEVAPWNGAARCGRVWESGTWAYRCRTCGHSPSMSLCVDCFKAAAHDGHDFNRFSSNSGGACDCGDSAVMRVDGFCPRHASTSSSASSLAPPPAHLTHVATFLLPKLLTRLLLRFREQFRMLCRGTDPLDGADAALQSHVAALVAAATPTVGLLQTIAEIGAPLRHCLVGALIDASLYVRLKQTSNDSTWVRLSLDWRSQSAFEVCKKSLASICDSSVEIQTDCAILQAGSLEYNCILDELVFWLVRLWYPQVLINFLLSLLPDDDFREPFSMCFFAHYPQTTAAVAERSKQGDVIGRRVVHASVQLVSGADSALELSRRLRLPLVLLSCLDAQLRPHLVRSALNRDSTGTRHRVVSGRSLFEGGQRLWALPSDATTLLGHAPVARELLADDAALRACLNVFSYFQAARTVRRISSGDHVAFEITELDFTVFSLEIVLLSPLIQSLPAACDARDHGELLISLTSAVEHQLSQWYSQIHFEPGDLPMPDELSFHLPLHRLYASCLSEMSRLGLDYSPPPKEFWLRLLMHPLRLQAARAEIQSGMWVRNGNSVLLENQAYVDRRYSAALFDLDLFLLQACVNYSNADYVVIYICELFSLSGWLTPWQLARVRSPRAEWQTTLVDSALRLLISLATRAVSNGMSADELARLELASYLCAADRTHSQLLDILPQSFLSDEATLQLERILPEIAVFREAHLCQSGVWQQGKYCPNETVWRDLFDPVFLMSRCATPKDYYAAMDRYRSFVQSKQKRTGGGEIWAPMRAAASQLLNAQNFLNWRSTHALVYLILYKASKDSNAVPEQTLHLVVYLLRLALHNSANLVNTNRRLSSAETEQVLGSTSTLRYLFFVFPTDSLVRNLTQRPVNISAESAHCSSGRRFKSSDDVALLHPEPSNSWLVDESMLSLLVALYRRLDETAGRRGRPQLDDAADDDDGWSGAAEQLRRVLALACRLDPACRMDVERACDQLWPAAADDTAAPSTSNAETTAEARRRDVKERQQRVLAEFAARQKRVMAKMLERERLATQQEDEQVEPTEDGEAAADGDECVVCGQAAAQPAGNPLGLVIRSLPSSVLGKARRLAGGATYGCMFEGQTRSQTERQWRRPCLTSATDPQFAHLHIDPSAHDAVLVRSCGHKIHRQCHIAYRNTLMGDGAEPATVYGLQVEAGEFLCPMCRQLSSGWLPLVAPPPPPISDHQSPPVTSDALQTVQQALKDDFRLRPRVTDENCRLSSEFFAGTRLTIDGVMEASAEENGHFGLHILWCFSSFTDIVRSAEFSSNLEYDLTLIEAGELTVSKNRAVFVVWLTVDTSVERKAMPVESGHRVRLLLSTPDKYLTGIERIQKARLTAEAQNQWREVDVIGLLALKLHTKNPRVLMAIDELAQSKQDEIEAAKNGVFSKTFYYLKALIFGTHVRLPAVDSGEETPATSPNFVLAAKSLESVVQRESTKAVPREHIKAAKDGRSKDGKAGNSKDGKAASSKDGKAASSKDGKAGSSKDGKAGSSKDGKAGSSKDGSFKAGSRRRRDMKKTEDE